MKIIRIKCKEYKEYGDTKNKTVVMSYFLGSFIHIVPLRHCSREEIIFVSICPCKMRG